jgi:hypothetical protein
MLLTVLAVWRLIRRCSRLWRAAAEPSAPASRQSCVRCC